MQDQNKDASENITLEEAMKKYNNKEIDVKTFNEIIAKFGLKARFWDMEKEPKYPEWDNNSRVGFKWNPFKSEPGQFFQDIIKKVIYRATDFVHEKMMSRYDNNIYEYDDPRFLDIDSFAKVYSATQYSRTKRDDFVNKIVDIALGICKEDIYHRARLLDAMNKFIATHPNGFTLTVEEKRNLDKWK